MAKSKVTEYITTKKAAQEIGYATHTLQLFCKNGLIKAKKFNHVYMIERNDWEEWKARNIKAVS